MYFYNFIIFTYSKMFGSRTELNNMAHLISPEK